MGDGDVGKLKVFNAYNMSIFARFRYLCANCDIILMQKLC